MRDFNLHFRTKLPEEFKQEFLKKIDQYNLRRSYLFALVAGVIFIMLLVLDYMRFQERELYSHRIYDYLFYLHLSGIVYFIFAALIKFKQKGFIDGRINPKFLIYGVLIFFALTGPVQDIVTYAEQHKMTMYLILILLANWVLLLPLGFRIAFTTISFLVVAPVVVLYGQQTQILLAVDLYELVGATIVVLIFGTVNYNFRVGKFLSEKLLEKEKKKIEELERFKSHMYTNLSHEFRTPLTMIYGMTETCRDQLGNKDAKGINSSLETVERNSHELLKLVNQMLDLSKLESKTMSLDLVAGDMVSFCRELIQPIQRFAIRKDIHLDMKTDLDRLIVQFDPEKLHAILTNLISNAIKFTPEDGFIQLTLNETDEHIVLKVRDSGYGIGKEHLPRLFDRFYQAKTGPTRKTTGTGIGLALCKELIELMGGTIDVASKLGAGTVFTLQMPLNKPEIDDVQREADSPFQPRAAKRPAQQFGVKELPLLLIVEDSKDFRAYLSELLENDYIIELAEDGIQGQMKAQQLIPDIIISDLMMPKKDGISMCKELKADEKTNHIPIILLTGKSGMDEKIKGLETGADAYMIKPFKKEELFVRLNQLTELRTKLQAKYAQMALLEDGVSDKQENKFIHKVNAIIEKELDNVDFNVEELSKQLFMSRMQLHRKLKALSNKSASNYIRCYRLYKSKKMLKDHSRNITDVAYDVGFRDSNYFSRSFSKEFGVTPSEFRSV